MQMLHLGEYVFSTGTCVHLSPCTMCTNGYIFGKRYYVRSFICKLSSDGYIFWDRSLSTGVTVAAWPLAASTLRFSRSASADSLYRCRSPGFRLPLSPGQVRGGFFGRTKSLIGGNDNSMKYEKKSETRLSWKKENVWSIVGSTLCQQNKENQKQLKWRNKNKIKQKTQKTRWYKTQKSLTDFALVFTWLLSTLFLYFSLKVIYHFIIPYYYSDLVDSFLEHYLCQRKSVMYYCFGTPSTFRTTHSDYWSRLQRVQKKPKFHHLVNCGGGRQLHQQAKWRALQAKPARSTF